MKTIREWLPDELIFEVQKQARRSTLGNFRTGAVVFNNDYEIISKGCSHHRAWVGKPSIHAEIDALGIFSGSRSGSGLNILIASIGRSGNYTYTSRPCYSCLSRIDKVGISEIYYPERDNVGSWIMNVERPDQMLKRCLQASVARENYARLMRVPPKGK